MQNLSILSVLLSSNHNLFKLQNSKEFLLAKSLSPLICTAKRVPTFTLRLCHHIRLFLLKHREDLIVVPLWQVVFINYPKSLIRSPIPTPYIHLTQSLNKGQKNQTMVRELSMVQVSHVGPCLAQLTHIQCWGHWSPCLGCGGAQSQKMGYFRTTSLDLAGLQNLLLGYFWVIWT